MIVRQSCQAVPRRGMKMDMKMQQGNAILFSEMTPDPAWEAEFNEWYDTEHIPLRMAVPGFASAQRYRSLKDNSYLAVYETGSLDAFKSEAYGKVKNQPSALTRKMLADV